MYLGPILNGVCLNDFPPRVEYKIDKINVVNDTARGYRKYHLKGYMYTFTLDWSKSLITAEQWAKIIALVNTKTTIELFPYPDTYPLNYFTVQCIDGIKGLEVFKYIGNGYKGRLVFQTVNLVQNIVKWGIDPSSIEPELVTDGLQQYLLGSAPAFSAFKVLDKSGNDRHANLVRSNCLDFDGGQATAGSGVYIVGTGDCTLSMWVKIEDESGTFPRIVNNGQFGITIDASDNSLDFSRQLYNNTSSGADYYTEGVWMHIVIVSDTTATTTAFYRDGALFSTSGSLGGTPTTGTRDFTIGNWAAGDRPADIRICDVRTWDKALTLNDVANLYNNDSNVETANLTSWHPLSEGNGTICYDVSGNDNNLTLSGTYSWATQDNFHFNILKGFEYYDDDATHAVITRVPYIYDETLLTPTITDYSKIGNNPAGAYHNNAETVVVAKQNLCFYSEEMGNAVWTKDDASITANSTTDPNGTSLADKVTGGTTSSPPHLYQVFSTTNLPHNRTYCISVWMRSASGGESVFIYMQEDGGDYSFWQGASKTIGTDWIRYDYTVYRENDGNPTRIGIAIPQSSNLYVWGWCVNEGSYPLKYYTITDTQISLAFSYSDIVANYNDSNTTFADVNTANQKHTLLTYNAPLSGINLYALQNYLGIT